MTSTTTAARPTWLGNLPAMLGSPEIRPRDNTDTAPVVTASWSVADTDDATFGVGVIRGGSRFEAFAWNLTPGEGHPSAHLNLPTKPTAEQMELLLQQVGVLPL